MNANEPVALVKKLTLGGCDNFIIERFVSLKEGTLLYTHPAKTLTDEEIKEVWQENLAVMGNDLDFARAILRKAQE